MARSRMTWFVGAAALGLVLAGGAGQAVAAGPVDGRAKVVPAADGSPLLASAADDYYVTYVARVCDDYTDIMANRARNNIQESLKDLGQDTVYNSGDPVRPAVEEAVPSQRDNCRPLDDWRLTLGQGYTGKTPGSLYLSTVTSPYSTNIVTKATTPLLDTNGQPTGDTIDGAVTVKLTQAQVDRAQRGNSLWVQGGTPSAPLNGLQEQYGFGALRCAIDNLNGDNVEWIGFPGQSRHVFCYYFAIQPPPSSSTIIVRKQLAAGTSGPAAFRYDGNISYADNNGDDTNDFILQPNTGSPASVTFIRGAGSDWDFEEQPTDGFVPTGPPVCTTSGGTGPTTIDIVGQKVTVNTAPLATVTCTFTNQADVTGPLTLSKVTRGGVGTFDFDVDFPTGTLVNYPVTTTEEGVAEVAAEIPSGPTGTYSVTENLPADSPLGTWELTGAECDGNDVAVTGTTFGGTVGLGQAVDCTVENTFTPGGSLTIRKTTTGGTGSFGYSVQQVDTDAEDLTGLSAEAVATVTSTGTPTTAVVNDGTSTLDLDALPVDTATSTYAVTELLPPESAEGRWEVTDISCTGASVEPSILGGTYVLVSITSGTPDVVCDFTNTFVPSSLLTIEKQIKGPASARDGAVVIETFCNEEGPLTLTVPTGRTSGSIGPFVLHGGQDCSVQETENGLASGATVSTTIAAFLDGDEVDSIDADGADFSLDPGDDARILFTDTYTASGGGGGGGGGTGGNGGGTGGSGGGLPDTGAGMLLPALRGSAALLAGGLLMLVGAGVVRRRFAD